MNRQHALALIAFEFGLLSASGTGGSGIDGRCASGTYLSDFGGLPARATVSVERRPVVSYDPLAVGGEYLLVAGEIRSQTAYYSFTAELYGNRGWGDMVDVLKNERFRIQIDLTVNGFILTANPFGGPASYQLTCE